MSKIEDCSRVSAPKVVDVTTLEAHIETLQENLSAQLTPPQAGRYEEQIEALGRVIEDARPDEAPALRAEVAALRSALVDVVNLGTDGGCTNGVSTEFLEQVPAECAAVKAQRNKARAEVERLQAVVAVVEEFRHSMHSYIMADDDYPPDLLAEFWSEFDDALEGS